MTNHLLATALMSAFVLDGCGLNCDNAACIDGADIVLTHSSSRSSLDGGHLRVCRDDLCSDGAITILGEIAFSANDLAITRALVDDHMLFLTVPPTQGVRLENGDVYTIELRDNAGTVVANKRWEATYTTLHPNGEDCSPTCRLATLD